MSLSPGVRLGPYEVTAALGAGGMGEVYRARDTRLGRDVAINRIYFLSPGGWIMESVVALSAPKALPRDAMTLSDFTAPDPRQRRRASALSCASVATSYSSWDRLPSAP